MAIEKKKIFVFKDEDEDIIFTTLCDDETTADLVFYNEMEGYLMSMESLVCESANMPYAHTDQILYWLQENDYLTCEAMEVMVPDEEYFKF